MWREMYIHRHRVLFHGCYISKASYMRYGENSFQVSPSLRFYVTSAREKPKYFYVLALRRRVSLDCVALDNKPFYNFNISAYFALTFTTVLHNQL